MTQRLADSMGMNKKEAKWYDGVLEQKKHKEEDKNEKAAQLIGRKQRATKGRKYRYWQVPKQERLGNIKERMGKRKF